MTDIIKKNQQVLFQNYSKYPITLTHGEGSYVWDDSNKKYLDFLSGIGCTSLGHNHPDIFDAIFSQSKKILHTSNLFYSLPQIELAELLIKNGALDKIFFCNSGTEAVEAGIKLARKFHFKKNHTEKQVILSAKHSFHGRTFGALAATDKESIKIGFGPLPSGFIYGDINDTESFLNLIQKNTAAVLLEPIQGEGGIHLCSQSFLQAVRKKCTETNTLLIFDEVQCGIGKTGHLFSFQHFDIQPDILLLAKGIANGLPLGAVAATHSVSDAFVPGDHGTTFGGNPVCCAASLAALKIISSKEMLQHIKNSSSFFINELKSIQKKYPKNIKEIRGQGLMIGIEFYNSPQIIWEYCLKSGLILNITAENVLRILPPFVAQKAEYEFALYIIEKSLFFSIN